MDSAVSEKKEVAITLSVDRATQDTDTLSRASCSTSGSLTVAIPEDEKTEKAKLSPVSNRMMTSAVATCLKYFQDCIRVLFLSSWHNLLLVFVPLAMLSDAFKWGYAVTFVFALIGLCVCAERLGFSTDQLGAHTNPTIGGLLNATMGNLGELMVSLQALQKGLLRVIQLSLLGSLVCNLLLAVGCAFLLGGLRFKVQKFAKDGANAGLGLLMVGMLAVVIPDALDATGTELNGERDVTMLSRLFSFVFLVVYAAFLYFQLVSHTELFVIQPKESSNGDKAAEATEKGGQAEEEQGPALGFWVAIVCISKFTFLMAILSDILLDCLEPAAKEMNLPLTFVSAILLPMVGNATEISASIVFALKNQLDTSLSIAVGSSIQIAFFVIPILVLCGWWMDIPFSMNFHVFETIVLFTSVAIIGLFIQDGKSNWMKGVTLVLAYVLIAGAYFHKTD